MNQTLAQSAPELTVPDRSVIGGAPDEAEDEKCLTLLPPKGWASLELGEVWQFRDLLWTLAGRDVKLRYRQTLLGAAWVVLQPLMAAAIFAFVFGRVARLTPGNNVPYFVFAYVSLIAWNLFGSTLNKAGSVLVGSSHLVSKVYFPRMVLPLSTAFGSLLDAGVSFAVLVLIMPVYHVMPGWGLATLPIWIALLMMLSLGIGLITAAMMVRYRDVQYILPVFTQMLLYASPVAYPLVAVPEAYRFWVNLNPLSGLLESFRWSVMGGTAPGLMSITAAATVSVTVFVAGACVFKRMEREFADVI